MTLKGSRPLGRVCTVVGDGYGMQLTVKLIFWFSVDPLTRTNKIDRNTRPLRSARSATEYDHGIEPVLLFCNSTYHVTSRLSGNSAGRGASYVTDFLYRASPHANFTWISCTKFCNLWAFIMLLLWTFNTCTRQRPSAQLHFIMMHTKCNEANQVS